MDSFLRPIVVTTLQYVARKEIGSPVGMQLVRGFLNDATPASASLRKFTTTGTSKGTRDVTASQRRVEEPLACDVSKVPDVSAHENPKTSLTA